MRKGRQPAGSLLIQQNLA